MSGSIAWYVARASGIVAWLMLTASVLWGIVLSTDLFRRWRRPAWLLDLHRWLGALTVGFVAIHLAGLVADTYVHFGVADLTLPFASAWKTGAVALGVVALWLLAAVEISSLLLRRLSRSTWHGIHLASYGVFWLTSLHAALAGTDAVRPLYQLTSALAVLAVVLATAYRVLTRSDPRGRRVPARARAVAASRR